MLTVYSKKNCPFCDKAKHLLNTKGVAYEEVNIEHDELAREFLRESGHRTVPQLYIGDQLFVEGGFTGLAKLSDDELKQRLTNANLTN
jgi:glutaredoxin 3